MEAEQAGVELVVLDLKEEAEVGAHFQSADFKVKPEVEAETVFVAKSGVEAQAQAWLQVKAEVKAEAAEVMKRKGREERVNVDPDLCLTLAIIKFILIWC